MPITDRSRFQFVKCQLETLRGAPSDKWIRAALQDLPTGLDDTYIRILEKIRAKFPRDLEFIRNLFFWLVHSVRPLSGQELAEAAFFSVDNGCLDFEAIPLDPKTLLQYSGGLFGIVDRNGIMGLTHFSVKTFLLSEAIRNSSVKDFFAGEKSVLPSLTMLCMDYLKLADFNSGQCYTRKQFSTRITKYRFLNYAACQWLVHYKQLPDSEAHECDASALDFFVGKKWAKNVLAWRQALRESNLEDYLNNIPSSMFAVLHPLDPIHHAAAHCLGRLTTLLLQNGSDPNAQGSRFGHPVLTAAFNSRSESEGLLKWSYILNLLEGGSDIRRPPILRRFAHILSANWTPDEQNFLEKLVAIGAFEQCPEELVTILEGVARHPGDHKEAASFLLRSGADPNSRYTLADLSNGRHEFNMPLHSACKSGNRSIADLLLSRGAHLNFVTTISGTPLQTAAAGGNLRIVQQLLDRQADPNIQGGHFGTPLQAAAWKGRADIVRALLAGGANVNVQGGDFGSVLNAAIFNGNQEVIELILQRQPNPNGGQGSLKVYDFARDMPLLRYARPIDRAITEGSTVLIRKLIDLGAELNPVVLCMYGSPFAGAVTGYHPLCISIMAKEFGIMGFLLERGSNPNAGDYCAMKCAARFATFNIFQKLLKGAEAADMARICAQAFYWCQDESFAMQLLDTMHQMDLKLFENVKGRLLFRSVEQDSLVRVKYLLEVGADPNASYAISEVLEGISFDASGSVLCRAIVMGLEAIIELLIHKGANTNVHDKGYGSPLAAAMELRYEQEKKLAAILSSLLKHGANPNTPSWSDGSRCWKVLHEAIRKENFEAVDVLLDHGADIEGACDWCGTAMMRAVETENADMIKHLVKRGASIDQLDAYGQTLYQRAREQCCFEAMEVLLSLGAATEPPKSDVQAQVEGTVAALVLGLPHLQGRGMEMLEYLKWTMLGRCLWLGDDMENAIVALEQSTFFEIPCLHCPRWPSLRPSSPYPTVRHLCKCGSATAICKGRCLEDHLNRLQQLGRLETHESIEFARPVFCGIPKGQVMFNDGTLLSRDEWLASLRGWKFKSADTAIAHR